MPLKMQLQKNGFIFSLLYEPAWGTAFSGEETRKANGLITKVSVFHYSYSKLCMFPRHGSFQVICHFEETMKDIIVLIISYWKFDFTSTFTVSFSAYFLHAMLRWSWYFIYWLKFIVTFYYCFFNVLAKSWLGFRCYAFQLSFSVRKCLFQTLKMDVYLETLKQFSTQKPLLYLLVSLIPRNTETKSCSLIKMQQLSSLLKSFISKVKRILLC